MHQHAIKQSTNACQNRPPTHSCHAHLNMVLMCSKNLFNFKPRVADDVEHKAVIVGLVVHKDARGERLGCAARYLARTKTPS